MVRVCDTFSRIPGNSPDPGGLLPGAASAVRMRTVRAPGLSLPAVAERVLTSGSSTALPGAPSCCSALRAPPAAGPRARGRHPGAVRALDVRRAVVARRRPRARRSDPRAGAPQRRPGDADAHDDPPRRPPTEVANARAACSSGRCSIAQWQIATSGSLSVWPSGVSAYSTCGGIVAITVRCTSPSASMLRSVCVSIFCEMPSIARRSSPWRRGPSTQRVDDQARPLVGDAVERLARLAVLVEHVRLDGPCQVLQFP